MRGGYPLALPGMSDFTGMSDDIATKKDLRQNWRQNWLNSIQEHADVDEQRRRWLDITEPSPHFQYGEYCCCYFDDLCLGDLGYPWALAEGLVSAQEVQAVAEFHALADAYDPAYGDDSAAVLADPKWLAVTDAARRAQVALLDLIKDPWERSLLTAR